MSTLRATGLGKAYAGTVVVDGVDLQVDGGEVVCLLGENGAGKSTVLKMLAGVVQPDAGSMAIDDASYAPASPGAAIAEGVGLIHQETSLILDMSIAENVFLGRQPTRNGRLDSRAMEDVARTHLRRLGSDLDPRRLVRGLPIADLQKIEIAKALALDARFLLLDEPTAALGLEDAEQLFRVVEQLRGEGVGFVFITHRLDEVREVGTRIAVMRDGSLVRLFDRNDVEEDVLVETMVDRPIDRVFPDPPPHRDEVVLSVRGLTRGRAFRDVSFEVRAGEIVGFAGLVGAGRTEVARALFGAEPADEGVIEVHGRAIRPGRPKDAIRAGIALVPEDRKHQGLQLQQSVSENVIAASMGKATTSGLLLPAKVGSIVRRMSEALRLKGGPRQAVGDLSGGNQQKVAIAKWLLTEPKVIIFDEPTRGIDVGAKEAVYDLIHDLAQQGVAVIVISSELPEVLGMSHRVLVLSRGKVTGILDRPDASQERVMSLAVAA